MDFLYRTPEIRSQVEQLRARRQATPATRFQPVLPMMPGMPEKRTRDYYRTKTAEEILDSLAEYLARSPAEDN